MEANPSDDGRTGDPRAAIDACARADSAIALIRLGCPDAAYIQLAKSQELWRPTGTDQGDLDIVAARLEVARGWLDVAEPLAASVRRWEGVSKRSHARSSIVLATIHVKAGEPNGLELAHGAITGITRLSSVRARRRLGPLIAALELRSSSDARQLARMARQVVATQAETSSGLNTVCGHGRGEVGLPADSPGSSRSGQFRAEAGCHEDEWLR
ncbi:MAG: hypothetical protein ACRDTG_20270 [Pseudonocardiaceae bacterium]